MGIAAKIKNKVRQVRELWESSWYEAQLGKRNRLEVFFDMALVRSRYQMTMVNYRAYGFALIRDPKIRETYLGSFLIKYIVRECNDLSKAAFDIEDKNSVYEFYKPYFHREIINLTQASITEFTDFVSRHPVFFAKETNNYGGQGVERVVTSATTDLSDLYQRLCTENKVLLEENIIQHPDLEALAPNSINTLRITTLVAKDGTMHMLPHVIRMGDGKSCVDNVTSGGMFIGVGDDGIIHAERAATETFNVPGVGNLLTYDKHPTSQKTFTGFQLPYFTQCVEMVKEMAAKEPALRFLGWDLAITPTGPCLVEVNNNPGCDLSSNYLHNGPDHVGTKPFIENVLQGSLDGKGFHPWNSVN